MGPEPTKSLDRDHRLAVRAQQVRLVFDNLPTSLAVNVVNAAIVAVFLWRSIPHPIILAWLSAHGAIAVARLLLLRGYRRLSPEPPRARRWAVYYSIGSACAGIAWGAGGLLMPFYLSLPYQVFVAFILGGMAVGSIAVNGPLMMAYLAFMLPALIPFDLWLFFQGDNLYQPMGLLGLVFMLGLYITARNLNSNIVHALRLTHEKNHLLSTLLSAKEEAERVNRDLEREVQGRRRAEAELREREGRYRAMFEKNRAVKLVIDARTGAILDANAAASAFYGYSPEELSRKSITDINTLPPEEVAVLMEQARAGQHDHFEFRHRLANGAERDVEVYVGAGEIDGREVLFSIVHDITQRKRAEQALKDSEQRYRVLYDKNPAMYFTLDAAGTVLSVNQFGAAHLGYQVEELIGHSVLEVIHPGDHAAFMEHLAGCTAGAETVSHKEWRKLRKDGRTLWVKELVRGVPNPPGEPVLLVVCDDITAQKEAEEQLRQHQDELAHMARLNIMGEMASGIAHELNQPLSAIANYAWGCARRLQSGDGDTASLSRVMKDVATQAERAGRILRGMRDLVRKGEMRKQRVEINQLVREVVPLAEIELKRVGVTLDLKLSTEPLVTLGVPIQIEQVIFNLVKNGIDAMKGIEGRVRRLTLETTINDSGTLQVSVADTGPGLPIQDSQDRLFGPFFTTKPHGMGMGLPISRSIVEAHGGRLWADSLPGGGAVFHFTLPRLRSPGTEQGALPGN